MHTRRTRARDALERDIDRARRRSARFQVEPPLVVAAISGAPWTRCPRPSSRWCSRSRRRCTGANAPEGGVCSRPRWAVAAPLDVWMILPLGAVPPTAQQLLASGHETPNSELVVGDVSADQPAARAAGALARPKKASTPAASRHRQAQCVRAPRVPSPACCSSTPCAGRAGDGRTGPPRRCHRTLQGRSATTARCCRPTTDARLPAARCSGRAWRPATRCRAGSPVARNRSR